MNWLDSILDHTQIDDSTILIRLFLSFILGGLIGWERESRRQPAGLRTHMLICLGATLLMLVSIFIPQTFKSFQNGDPGRIAAQVVSGIGFLGAGAIFRLGINVRGLTTAATIWVVAAVGLAVGAGVYAGAIIATIFILFTLIIIDKIENRLFPAQHMKILQIHFQSKKIETDEVFAVMDKYKIKVQSMNMLQSVDKAQVKLKFIVRIPHSVELKKLYKDLNCIDSVRQIMLGHDF
jgi:putative Mg2+ transporter-C (MgtC) family protein